MLMRRSSNLVDMESSKLKNYVRGRCRLGLELLPDHVFRKFHVHPTLQRPGTVEVGAGFMSSHLEREVVVFPCTGEAGTVAKLLVDAV
jgi:hypothetical protein